MARLGLEEAYVIFLLMKIQRESQRAIKKCLTSKDSMINEEYHKSTRSKYTRGCQNNKCGTEEK